MANQKYQNILKIAVRLLITGRLFLLGSLRLITVIKIRAIRAREKVEHGLLE